MSFDLSHDIKEQVRQATDIVDLVSRSIQLRRQGRNFVGICPWHDDARPSLQVNAERQSWKCWVCDIGGDVFSFVMKREGVDFPTALQMLAERAGIQLTQHRQAKIEPGSPNDRQTLYRAMAWAEQQYHECLLNAPEAAPARQYLLDRGLNDDSVKRFHIGFAPQSFQWLLDRARSKEFSPAVLIAAGLATRKSEQRNPYDSFRGRLMFPIRDTEHRPVAFGGRILPELERDPNRPSPKYINTPETRLFSKSNQLYGLDIVRDAITRERRIVVVEGYTDVVMAHQCGVNNVVAVLGTALGERVIRLLQRYADTVTLVLDGDDAGKKRANEILELFVAAQLDLRILTLPDGLDPCDFLRNQGAEPFRQLLEQAVDALEHRLRVATENLDPVTQPDQAHRALEGILRTLAAAPRLRTGANESTRLREQQMLARLARHFHVDETNIRARLLELRSTAKRTPSATQETNPTSGKGMTPHEIELFEIMVLHPDLARRALAAIDAGAISSESARSVWELFERAARENVELEFEQVLTVAEDASLKSLLVKLIDRAQEKAELAGETAEERLSGLIHDFDERREELSQRAALAALEKRDYDEEEEVRILVKLIEGKRGR